MNTGLMFSSKDMTHETPQDLFDKLDAEFHFNTDVCAVAATAKCDHFFSPEDDAFTKKWFGVCWMNPPYGREIGGWIAKAKAEAKKGAVVVCLVPSRTDTAWWHDNIWDEEAQKPQRGVEVRLMRGRLKFGGMKNSAPFPSAVVIFSG